MRTHIKRLLLIFTAIMYGLFISAPAVTHAQTSNNRNTANNGQALEIAPPVIYLTVNPGETVKTQILIRDISSGNLIVTGTVNDFVSGGEDGTPKILLDKDKDTSPYSLVSWVAPLPSLLLVPREIKTMTATINVPKDASPGGHYGVIRFTSTPPSLDGSGVSLAASIGVLVLLTVNGDIKQSLAVQELTVSKGGKKGSFFESGPLQFEEKLKNTGNVHLQPSGQVTVTDMFGKKVGAVNVNLPPANVLPQSTRAFKQPFDKTVIGNKKLFGRYKATLKVTYGSDKQVATSSVTFWVIPYKLIILIIVLLVGAFFLFRFLIRRYNRRIVSQSQKRNRK